MNIKLYQVNMDRDEDSAAFLSLDNLRHTHPNAAVDPAIYDLVYSGEVNCKDLEEVFHLFNFDHPADFTGRSIRWASLTLSSYGKTSWSCGKYGR